MHPFLPLAASLLLLPLTAAEPVLRTYDLHALLERPTDAGQCPFDDADLGPFLAGSLEGKTRKEIEAETIQPAQVVDLARMIAWPNGEAPQGESIAQALGSHLVVNVNPEAQARVGRALADLERDLYAPVRVEVRALWMDQAPAGGKVEAEAVERASAVAGAVAGEVVLSGVNRQRLSGMSGNQQGIVADFDIVQSALDPACKNLRDGLMVQVRPTLHADGVTVSLDVQAQLVAKLEIQARTFSLVSVEPKRAPSSAQLDLPRWTGLQRLQANPTGLIGEWRLAGVLASDPTARRLVVLTRVER